MKPKLISFKLCPYVQKAVLTLLTKHIDFDIEYIDLENPPQWFSDISPLGKVPVLKVGDQALVGSLRLLLGPGSEGGHQAPPGVRQPGESGEREQGPANPRIAILREAQRLAGDPVHRPTVMTRDLAERLGGLGPIRS